MGGIITLVKRSVQSFGTDKCATLSAAIAYRTIFSLFPMALVGVSILGFFLDDAAARRQVIDGIAKVISLGPEGETALAGTLEGVSRARGVFGIVGLVLAAWSASGLFGEIRSALNAVWDVDLPRPMLRAKAQDLLLMFGFGGLLIASTASTGVLQAARQAGSDWIGPLLDLADPVFALLVFVAPLLLTIAAFLFLYRFAPHARLGWRDVLPAALIAALFFEFGKNLLTYYISNLGNFNALAGSLGAAILFLVFVYYASQVILFAAEIAKHRMLVATGTLPATDPTLSGPNVPLTEKLKRSLVRLWTVGEAHHDGELPYQPARIDPATNRPANTREAVLLKHQQALKNAAEDAGVSTHTNGAHAAAAPPAVPSHIQPGDWASAGTDDRGAVRRVDVHRQSSRAAGDEGARRAWQAAGFVVPLLLSGLLKRERYDTRDACDESGRRRARHNPRRRSQP
jgi:membrane protein